MSSGCFTRTSRCKITHAYSSYHVWLGQVVWVSGSSNILIRVNLVFWGISWVGCQLSSCRSVWWIREGFVEEMMASKTESKRMNRNNPHIRRWMTVASPVCIGQVQGGEETRRIKRASQDRLRPPLLGRPALMPCQRLAKKGVCLFYLKFSLRSLDFLWFLFCGLPFLCLLATAIVDSLFLF